MSGSTNKTSDLTEESTTTKKNIEELGVNQEKSGVKPQD